MPWLQISVTTGEQSADTVAEQFNDLGAVSVTFQDAAEQPVYEPAPGETRIWTETRVIGLFEPDHDAALISARVCAALGAIPLQDWHHEILQDQAWERLWLAHYQPMKFGRRLWVCPTGQERYEADTVCLVLDPGLAFGTGTHPTTALCLDWLAENDLTGKTLVDYGCGSGILAIAAILLGARAVYAVDIDPQALTATVGNAEKNRVMARVHTCLPENLPDLQADIVLANILAKPLQELATTIISRLKPGGQMILSGILQDQASQVIDCYSPYLTMSPTVCREDWCRLEGCK